MSPLTDIVVVLLFLSSAAHQPCSCELKTSHPLTQKGLQEMTSCELWWHLKLFWVRHVLVDSFIASQTMRTTSGCGSGSEFSSLPGLRCCFSSLSNLHTFAWHLPNYCSFVDSWVLNPKLSNNWHEWVQYLYPSIYEKWLFPNTAFRVVEKTCGQI